MTYGDTGGALRHELATLLRQHRIQQRLGGPGLWTVPESTTLEQRRTLGEQIGRYRHAVLIWCLQAVAATGPDIGVAATGRSADPVDELRHRLTSVIEASPAGLPPLSELTSQQPFGILETWRRAARAAALGEHDFAAGVGYGSLDERQRWVVITDVADIVQALVVLDKRYANVPDWTSLREPGRLRQAATVCADVGGYVERGFTVDLRGWRQPHAVIEGPPPPDIGGVLQAVHNTLIHLAVFPTARNLRLVIEAQTLLSHEAAVRVHSLAPTLATRWLTREQTYASLLREARDLGGLVGRGGLAVAESTNSVSRLRRLRSDDLQGTERQHQLDRLFTRIDRRVSDIIEQGARKHLYFLRGRLPRMATQSAKLIKPAQAGYVPITSPLQTHLLVVVRTQLRPHPDPAAPPRGAADSRQELRDALTHRPAQDRQTSPSQESCQVRVVGL